MLRTRWTVGVAAWLVGVGLGVVACGQTPPREHALIALIKQQQRIHVGESSGEWHYQCFTWESLARFKSDDVPGGIIKTLKKDPAFAQIARGVAKMSGQDRNRLLRQARATYKPTWRQLGRISGEGQTDAGQAAERLIAAAIADLAAAPPEPAR
jgi:hypothetical protein